MEVVYISDQKLEAEPYYFILMITFPNLRILLVISVEINRRENGEIGLPSQPIGLPTAPRLTLWTSDDCLVLFQSSTNL